MQFVDADHGWAVTDAANDGSDGRSVRNGAAFGLGLGRRRRAHHQRRRHLDPGLFASDVALRAVDFVDDQTGWAAGGDVSWDTNPEPAVIYGTTDGGETWARQTLPALPGFESVLEDLSFTVAANGWAVGLSYVPAPPFFKQSADVLRTTDGGGHWALVPGLDQTGATAVRFSDAQHGWIGGSTGVYATTDGGSSWQRVAGGDGVTAIAAADPQDVWAFGLGFLASTLDASGDSAAPLTLVDDGAALFGWQRGPVAVGLKAGDAGGSGVAGVQFSIDGAGWQPGTSAMIDAPASHGNDGPHTILFRSTDVAGNQEQTEATTVGIDTLGPSCSAPRNPRVDTGERGILRFKVDDEMSGVASATITISNRAGRVVRRIVERPTGAWFGSVPYFWLRFKCTFKPGIYHVTVRATDLAGNKQVRVGRGSLTVVASGAPAARAPQWPAGLPSGTMPAGAPLQSSLGAGHAAAGRLAALLGVPVRRVR